MALAPEQERSTASVDRRSPAASVGWVLPGVVLALFALKVVGPIRDPDAYWHIAAGAHLQHTWDFVLADPFGAATERTWILNQWLPELLMHWSYSAAGFAGVAFLLSIGALLVGWSVWHACRTDASALVTALVVVVTFIALSGSLSPRPQLVTFALVAVTTGAWLRTRDDGRTRWWLVPMTWVWAMSHGLWFVGPLVGLVVVAGLLLDRRVAVNQGLRLALVPVLSVMVAALTPVGPQLFTSPFQVSEVTAYISEWQRPSLTDPALWAALLLVLAVIVDQVGSRARRSWTVLLLVLVGLAFAVAYSRTVGIGAVIAAPLAAMAIQAMTAQRQSAPDRREHLATATLAGLALAVAAMLAVTGARAPGLGPNALDGALDDLPSGTVVCNDQVDGGWLMLRHPGLRSTMDTRVELYSVDHILAYHAFLTARPGWSDYVSRVGCTAAVLPATSPVVAAMTAGTTPGQTWRTVASGDGYALLVGP